MSSLPKSTCSKKDSATDMRASLRQEGQRKLEWGVKGRGGKGWRNGWETKAVGVKWERIKVGEGGRREGKEGEENDNENIQTHTLRFYPTHTHTHTPSATVFGVHVHSGSTYTHMCVCYVYLVHL